MMANKLFQQLLFWGVWLVIPLICEIFAGIVSGIVVIVKYFLKKRPALDYYPDVSIIIPVYNSEKSLWRCLESIQKQDYPEDRIEVLLIDNGSADDSFQIFNRFQRENPKLRLWWYHSSQGKSKALNHGVFRSKGKYIINIDSDGSLDSQAIKTVVQRFENDPGISCMTGIVLINPDTIENTGNALLKTLRLCEFIEYNESFMVGRNFQSVLNTVYSMAGAFSCFRREIIFKTQMFSAETMGEDMHMTFQIRQFGGGRIALCEDAFFFTDPIEGINKLYVQRQRWQRAELEVAHLFSEEHTGIFKGILTKFPLRKLILDHTLAFPRLVWFFAMIYLYFINYPLKLLVGANLLLYFSYTANSFLHLAITGLYLKQQKKVRNYALRHWYVCFLMPFYRFVIYWMRVAGIINSITTESKWHTKNLSQEVQIVREGLKKGLGPLPRLYEAIKKVINIEN